MELSVQLICLPIGLQRAITVLEATSQSDHSPDRRFLAKLQSWMMNRKATIAMPAHQAITTARNANRATSVTDISIQGVPVSLGITKANQDQLTNNAKFVMTERFQKGWAVLLAQIAQEFFLKSNLTDSCINDFWRTCMGDEICSRPHSLDRRPLQLLCRRIGMD